jgi:hypothetical protein
MKYGLTIDIGPSIKRKTTMRQYIGLDVSLKDSFISTREDGKRIWRGKCPRDPQLIAEVTPPHLFHSLAHASQQSDICRVSQIGHLDSLSTDMVRDLRVPDIRPEPHRDRPFGDRRSPDIEPGVFDRV